MEILFPNKNHLMGDFKNMLCHLHTENFAFKISFQGGLFKAYFDFNDTKEMLENTKEMR